MHICTDVLLCLDVLHADRISRGKSKNCELENWVAGRHETQRVPFSTATVADHVS